MPSGLQPRVIAATYHSRMDAGLFDVQTARGMQIRCNVIRRQPRDWLAIDDDYLDWPSWYRDKLVVTDATLLGINAPAVLEALRAKLSVRFALTCRFQKTNFKCQDRRGDRISSSSALWEARTTTHGLCRHLH
jgi:hypothetical protein